MTVLKALSGLFLIAGVLAAGYCLAVAHAALWLAAVPISIAMLSAAVLCRLCFMVPQKRNARILLDIFCVYSTFAVVLTLWTAISHSA